MVNTKLIFCRVFFLYFDNTDNQVIQNPIPTFRQSSVISEKRGYFFEELKILTSSTHHRV